MKYFFPFTDPHSQYLNPQSTALSPSIFHSHFAFALTSKMDQVKKDGTTHSEANLAGLLKLINAAALAQRASNELSDPYNDFLPGQTQTARVVELDELNGPDNYDFNFSAFKKAVDEKLASTLEIKLAAVLKRIAELEAQVAAEKILKKKEKALKKKQKAT